VKDFTSKLLSGASDAQIEEVREKFNVKWDSALARELHRFKPHLVHIIAHGSSGTLQLSGFVPTSRALSAALGQCKDPMRLVIINACETDAFVAQVAAEFDTAVVVGTRQLSVPLTWLRFFCSGVYAALAASEPIQSAFECGLLDIQMSVAEDLTTNDELSTKYFQLSAGKSANAGVDLFSIIQQCTTQGVCLCWILLFSFFFLLYLFYFIYCILFNYFF